MPGQTAQTACLSDDDILRFASGQEDAARLSAIEEHLAVCSNCTALVAETAKLAQEEHSVSESASFHITTIDSAVPRAERDGRLAPGTLVGRYEVREIVGAGGMGIVYVAYDPVLRRRIALKVLHASNLSAALLLREARAMAKLTHPNVVVVHDLGVHEGAVAFIAMELVEGETMRNWLRRGGRSWRTVLDFFLQTGEGLAAAHDVGLIHRDFKPENVLIGHDGRPRVTDFGLARRTGKDDDDTFRSGTGRTSGTPAYMAPEQVLGDPLDARLDQFAFCVALHEGLYGQRPFAGTSAAEQLAARMAGHVRPAPEVTDVPQALREVIVRGLAVSPQNRYASMRDLLGALRSAAEAATPRKRPRRLRGWVASAAATTALGALGLAIHSRTRPIESEATVRVEVPSSSPTGSASSASQSSVATVTSPPGVAGVTSQARASADIPSTAAAAISTPPVRSPARSATPKRNKRASAPPAGDTLENPFAK